MSDLTAFLIPALQDLAAHEDELRDVDAAAGDGDLGITVRSTCDASVAWLQAHPDVSDWPTALAGLSEVVASTNPSTFASLISRGLRAAGKALTADPSAARPDVVCFDAFVAMVQKRGGAKVGDKTFLDALIPAVEQLRTATSFAAAVPAMHAAAVSGLESTRDVLPQHGRAAWLGERARGLPDAGSVVVVRLLEAFDADVAAWSQEQVA